MQELLRGERTVQRNIDEAGGEAGIVGDSPLGPVLGENRDARTGWHAEGTEPESDVAHAFGERAVRNRLVAAADLHLQCARAVVAVDGLVEEPVESDRRDEILITLLSGGYRASGHRFLQRDGELLLGDPDRVVHSETDRRRRSAGLCRVRRHDHRIGRRSGEWRDA